FHLVAIERGLCRLYRICIVQGHLVRLRSWNKQAPQERYEKHPEIHVALLRALGVEAALKIT
ncbi:MAG: hypothetical protein P8P20_11020, partial [Acidimicrobiales bacterium]|nr:hypothetical protein [Acidimicrobiales bacterium]